MPNKGQVTYYSTTQLCKLTGMHRTTLLRWIRMGHLPEPGCTTAGRVWTDSDVARVKRVKAAIYRPDRAAAGLKSGAMLRAAAEAVRKAAESAAASA